MQLLLTSLSRQSCRLNECNDHNINKTFSSYFGQLNDSNQDTVTYVDIEYVLSCK